MSKDSGNSKLTKRPNETFKDSVDRGMFGSLTSLTNGGWATLLAIIIIVGVVYLLIQVFNG